MDGSMPREKRYMMRRTLSPWKFDETIEEAVRYATEFGIDEIIWMIDTEEFSHGLPTLDRIAGFIPALNDSRRRLAEVGVSMSINPWATQGMRDAGMNMRDMHLDFDWMVNIDGREANTIACPLGAAWRKWLTDAYLMYAGTKPRVLWLEDDMRVHGHTPVVFGCFCENHVRALSQRVGRELSREQLVAEVLAPGEPSELRSAWLDLEGEGITEVIEMVCDVVYREHPDVKIGLMTSAPWNPSSNSFLMTLRGLISVRGPSVRLGTHGR